MPPLYDNIVDALELTQDGASHTVALDTQASTLEANEATYNDGYDGVWVKIDLSTYPTVMNVVVTMQATRTGGDAAYHPYVDTWKVFDPTFDPASPDFSKLKYVSGAYVGDGTVSPPADSWTLKGGTWASVGNSDNKSRTGVFYLVVTDWDFASSGTLNLEYSVEAAPYCLDAVDVINPDSTTATVVSGRVKEAYNGYWDSGYVPENQKEAALKFTWTSDPGLYKVSTLGRYPNPGSGTFFQGRARILISVNGKAILPVYTYQSFAAFDTDASWFQYPGLTGGTWDAANDYGRTWIPLNTGDVIEVFIVSYSRTSSPTAFLPFHLEQICFWSDPNAPATTYCTPVFEFPAEPLGDQWGSPNGWGGQWMVPDEIYTLLGVTRYNEAVYNPWAVNWVDFDMCALDDGTVYVIVHDSWNAGAGTPSTNYHYVVVRKYDPGTDSWSQVATLNIRDPEDRYYAEAVSCKYDGTYVYLVWWELDTYGPGGTPPTQVWRWHCKRLDPTDDSITELGTGQAARTGLATVNYPSSVLANSIACEGNGGDVYIGSIEYDDNTDFDQRLFVWRWNGSTWTDLALPDPSEISPVNKFDITGENSFYDVLSSIVCARHSVGPVTDGFTLVYGYYWQYGAAAEYAAITIPYTVGSGWGTEIRTEVETVELGPPNRMRWTSSGEPRGAWVDMDLMWSPNREKLVLSVDFLHSGSDGFWDVLQMNDAGTQWEVYDSIAPAEVTGSWNQSRNTAAIGPDGEVYAARFSTSVDESGDWFKPKLFKTSPGYLAGFSVAGVPALGEVVTPYPWHPFLEATSHYRIRIVGNDAYLMFAMYAQDDDGAGGWGGSEGEGIYVFKLPYAPCGDYTLVSLAGLRWPPRRDGARHSIPRTVA